MNRCEWMLLLMLASLLAIALALFFWPSLAAGG